MILKKSKKKILQEDWEVNYMKNNHYYKKNH